MALLRLTNIVHRYDPIDIISVECPLNLVVEVDTNELFVGNLCPYFIPQTLALLCVSLTGCRQSVVTIIVVYIYIYYCNACRIHVCMI